MLQMNLSNACEEYVRFRFAFAFAGRKVRRDRFRRSQRMSGFHRTRAHLCQPLAVHGTDRLTCGGFAGSRRGVTARARREGWQIVAGGAAQSASCQAAGRGGLANRCSLAAPAAAPRGPAPVAAAQWLPGGEPAAAPHRRATLASWLAAR